MSENNAIKKSLKQNTQNLKRKISKLEIAITCRIITFIFKYKIFYVLK